MSLHILHGCERLKSTDDPAQEKTQNTPRLLGVLMEMNQAITGAKALE